jgi:hypothetical protein
MLGFKSARKDDSLPVLVNIIEDAETFGLVQKVWDANTRNIRQSSANRKEFLRFGMMESNQAVWLERDMGRSDAFELVLTWTEDGKHYFDVYALVATSPGVTSGDSSYAKQILVALLTTPATLPVDQQK